jgi:hypothetical protein
MLELTEHSILNELCRAAEITRRALLAADLESHIVLLDCRNDRLSLREGMGHGLLAIDVLLVVGRLDATLGMPVIRGGYTDCIDLLISEKLPEVAVALAVIVLVALVDLVLGMSHVVIVNITDSHDLGILIAHEGAHIAAPHAADPDVAEHDPLTGRNSSAQSKGAAGYKIGNG